ncbi:MAG: membrane protein insertion efficiency factor YidD [Ignavibacteria bacterium]|nr:membrane protein insertion efficiency factor YidD [Ignavibacteria bacterium]
MKRLLIGTIRLYQLTISPLFAGSCRFHPSCSQYAIDAMNKYGAASGTVRSIKRLFRCHPFNPGGVDPA